MIEINVANQFSRFPYGRKKEHTKTSGEAFREGLLLPALKKAAPDETVTVVLDGTSGYGSSFLDEVFGGLVRKNNFSQQDVESKIVIVSKEDPLLIEEIRQYVKEAAQEKR
ncbi:MAG: STAS-like domain-containing protein [Rickettsiales bacterium]